MGGAKKMLTCHEKQVKCNMALPHQSRVPGYLVTSIMLTSNPWLWWNTVEVIFNQKYLEIKHQTCVTHMCSALKGWVDNPSSWTWPGKIGFSAFLPQQLKAATPDEAEVTVQPGENPSSAKA